MSEVTQTIVRQVRDQVFVKPGQIFLIDDEAVRFRLTAYHSVDVRYDGGRDLYDVTVNRMKRKTYETSSETASGVYAEDLARYFPERLVEDANVRAFLATLTKRL